MRTKNVVCATLLTLAVAGCGEGANDPLLYDAEGKLRDSVTLAELQDTTLPTSCAAYRELLAGERNIVQVQIADEPRVLVGVHGKPVCVESLAEDDEAAPLGLGEKADGGCYSTTRKQCYCHDAGFVGMVRCRLVTYSCCPYGCCWASCTPYAYGSWYFGSGWCVP